MTLGTIMGSAATALWIAIDTRRFARFWWRRDNADWRYWTLRLFATTCVLGAAASLTDVSSRDSFSSEDWFKALPIVFLIVGFFAAVVFGVEHVRQWAAHRHQRQISNIAEWRDFRSVKWQAFGMFLGFPVLMVMGALLQMLTGSTAPFFVLEIAWMIVWLVATMKLVHWPCPRCGEPFVGPLWFLPSARCRHCKLKVGSPIRAGS
jgi:hypothetical protein